MVVAQEVVDVGVSLEHCEHQGTFILFVVGAVVLKDVDDVIQLGGLVSHVWRPSVRQCLEVLLWCSSGRGERSCVP